MKSFLNRFRRNEDDEEQPSSPSGTPAEAKESAGAEKDKPLRRTGISVAPPTTPPEGKKGGNQPSGNSAPKEEELVLELGDFLHRIPPQLLVPGTPDVHTELRFGLADIAERIARGETTIPLAELHPKVPHLFVNEIAKFDDLEIRFPWQKVLKLINETAPGKVAPTSSLTVAAAESLAHKLKTRHTARNIMTGRGAGGLNVPESPLGKAGSKLAQRPVTWFSRPSAPQGTTAERSTEAATPTTEAEGQDAAPGTEAPTEAKVHATEASAPSTPMGVEDSTALVESMRAELEQELQARDEELARVHEEYQRQIDSLQEEIAALKKEREATGAGESAPE